MPKKRKKYKKKYQFHLYVTGASMNSLAAIANIKKLCEEKFTQNYELEIIDVYQQPHVTRKENIVALPLFIKKYPLPEKRFIGTMSDKDKLVSGIG